jgi:7-cyano-7-deazaguanine synthase
MRTALLLSGGMDSIALAQWKKPALAIHIDYGQRAACGERRAARAVCHALGIPLESIDVDCRKLGSGDMAGAPPLDVAPLREWWPFRNQLLITLGSMRIIGQGYGRIMIGTVKGDANHSDGSARFIQLMRDLLAYQEGGIEVDAPALNLTTAELVRAATVPVDILAWSHSCHMGPVACGNCGGCAKHFRVMQALGHEPY